MQGRRFRKRSGKSLHGLLGIFSLQTLKKVLNTNGYIDLVHYWAPKVRRYVFPYLRGDFNSLGDRECAFVNYYNRKNNVAIVIQYCILFVYNTVLYKTKENANQLGYTS